MCNFSHIDCTPDGENMTEVNPQWSFQKMFTKTLPPKKPAAVVAAEHVLRRAREKQAEAEAVHFATIHAKDTAGRSIATGSNDSRLRAEHRAAAEALAEAKAATKSARQGLKEAREKWRPAYRKAVEPMAEQVEATLREGLAIVESAAAALTDLDLESERHGGMPKPGLIYQARSIALALDGLKRSLKR